MFTFVTARVLRRFPAYTSRHMARLAGRVTVDDVTTLRTTAYRYTSRAQSATREPMWAAAARAVRGRCKREPPLLSWLVSPRATAQAVCMRIVQKNAAHQQHRYAQKLQRNSCSPSSMGHVDRTR